MSSVKIYRYVCDECAKTIDTETHVVGHFVTAPDGWFRLDGPSFKHLDFCSVGCVTASTQRGEA